MKFLDLFAGIGGFRLGMEMAGHECVGHCEIDKFANASYIAMHKPKEGEWYAGDITKVRADELPRADCWCFGFPCQDISVAGRQKGFGGKRSSLFFTVTRLIRDIEEKDRPAILFIENVKNLLSINGGFDFARLLVELDEIGYDAEWQVLNSKDFGVPQNRERVFIIGHLRGRAGREVFPVGRNDKQTGVPIKQGSGRGHYVIFQRPRGKNNGGTHDICPTITGTKWEQNNFVIPDYIAKPADICRTVRASGRSSGNAKHNWDIVFDGIQIRRLTPRECFRLQGFPDEYFDRAWAVNSDTQLYKQAGNSVTVNVIYEIAKRLEATENGE